MAASKNKQEWVQNTLDPALKKSAEREEQFLTTSGTPLEGVYSPDDMDGFDYDQDLGFPAEYPFTRGVQP
ncbi:MAG: methylmalonyl-CoA mutase, partial [Chloroflexi bacterium]|nr:methylmalonyl-CoA mutase [Chloroflexota bacterium]